MRSPHTAGVPPLGPGSGADHLTDSLVHFSGRPVSGEEPLNAGPRHCGQFSPWAAKARARRAAIVWRGFIGGLIDCQEYLILFPGSISKLNVWRSAVCGLSTSATNFM